MGVGEAGAAPEPTTTFFELRLSRFVLVALVSPSIVNERRRANLINWTSICFNSDLDSANKAHPSMEDRSSQFEFHFADRVPTGFTKRPDQVELERKRNARKPNAADVNLFSASNNCSFRSLITDFILKIKWKSP
jgi:hypothetical protein